MIQIDAVFNVSAEKLFTAWLDSDQHTAMTGGTAQVSSVPNDEFTAWDGYIEGVNLQVEFPVRIIQTWRTTEFDFTDEDSLLTLEFEVIDENQTRLRLLHERLPEGSDAQYAQGWRDHYFTPMQAYFKA